MKTPIADHKAICRAIAPAGWVYTGFDEGYYCFQTGDYKAGFKEMRTLPEDWTTENMALMVRLGVTR